MLVKANFVQPGSATPPPTTEPDAIEKTMLIIILRPNKSLLLEDTPMLMAYMAATNVVDCALRIPARQNSNPSGSKGSNR